MAPGRPGRSGAFSFAMFRKKEKQKAEVNLLELIPSRRAEWEADEEGIVTIFKPKVTSRLMKKLIEPRLKSKHMKIKLDELGSAVWALCDGERPVSEMIEALRERFGETIEPCEERLSLFMAMLEGEGFVCFENYEDCRRVTGE